MSHTTTRPAYRHAVKFAWRNITLRKKVFDLAVGAVTFFLLGMFTLHAPLAINLLAGVLGAAGVLLLDVLNQARESHMFYKRRLLRQDDGRPTFRKALTWVWTSYLHRKLFVGPLVFTSLMVGAMLFADLLSDASILSTLATVVAGVIFFVLAFAYRYLMYALEVYQEQCESWDADHSDMPQGN